MVALRDVYHEKEGDCIEAGVMKLVRFYAGGPKMCASVTKCRKIREKCAKNARNGVRFRGYAKV